MIKKVGVLFIFITIFCVSAVLCFGDEGTGENKTDTVTTEAISIEIPVAPPPVLQEGFSFITKQTVAVPVVSGTTVIYTIDGTDPSDENGKEITKDVRLIINATVKLKAISKKSGYKNSEVVSAEYKKAVLKSIEIISLPAKTEYSVGDKTLDTDGLSVNGIYSNGEKAVLNLKASNIKGFEAKKAGKKNIYISTGGKTAVFQIIVKARDNSVITSNTYTVSKGNGMQETISKVGFGTSKETFLSLLSMGGENQRWETKDISPVVENGNKLQVYAEDGKTNTVYIVNVNPDTTKYILITGGKFTMGDTIGGGENDETVHQVAISDFYMAKNEVTQGEYEKLMKNNPSYFNINGKNRPVERVTWYDAAYYCNLLSIAENIQPYYSIEILKGGDGTAVTDSKVKIIGGRGYRLPTEAEWEYAARNRGEKIRFGNGKETADSGEINYRPGEFSYEKKGGNFKGKAVDTGVFAPNGLGLFDMAGNIEEWCWDWYGSYSKEETADPKGAEKGRDRVTRGGSWLSPADKIRSTYRNGNKPGEAKEFIGFRVVRSKN